MHVDVARVMSAAGGQLQPSDSKVVAPGCSTTTCRPPGRRVRGTAHHPDDQVERRSGTRRRRPSGARRMARIVTQGRIQRAAQRVVLGWQHTVFAVVAGRAGQKGHRFLGALRHRLAVRSAAQRLSWAPMSGGNRSRTEASRANQWA